MKRYRGVLIFLLLALLALSGAVWYYDRKLGYLCLGAAAFVTLTVSLLLMGVARRQQQLMVSSQSPSMMTCFFSAQTLTIGSSTAAISCPRRCGPQLLRYPPA